MTDAINEYGKIFSKNLKRIAYDRGKTQADIARDLKFKQATVSSWMVGTRVPRMDKVDALCRYFRCSRTELLDDKRGYANTAGSSNLFEADCETLFDSLNDAGKEQALFYMRYLLSDDRYKKEAEHFA